MRSLPCPETSCTTRPATRRHTAGYRRHRIVGLLFFIQQESKHQLRVEHWNSTIHSKYFNSSIVMQLYFYTLNLHLDVTLQHTNPLNVKRKFIFWLIVRDLHIRCRNVDATSESLAISYFSTAFNFTSFSQVRFVFYWISSYTSTIISNYISYIKILNLQFLLFLLYFTCRWY
jgi:hypothetical protein